MAMTTSKGVATKASPFFHLKSRFDAVRSARKPNIKDAADTARPIIL